MEAQQREVERAMMYQGAMEIASPGPEGGGEDDDTDLNCCWICLSAVDIGEPSCLKPCLCRGTIAFVHKECIEGWVKKSGRLNCTRCGFEYLTTLEFRYPSILHAACAWVMSLSPNELLYLGSSLIGTILGAPIIAIFWWAYFLALLHLPGLQMLWFVSSISGYSKLDLTLVMFPCVLYSAMWGIAFIIVYRDLTNRWTEWYWKNKYNVQVFSMPPAPEPQPQEEAGSSEHLRRRR